MSTQPIQFHHTAFTSNYNDKPYYHHSLFNIALVILTAVFFFLVLSWYNFLLSLYNYYLNPSGDPKNTPRKLKREMLGSLGFAFIWLLLAIALYWYLTSSNLLYDTTGKENKYWESHPLLRSDDISSRVDMFKAV